MTYRQPFRGEYAITQGYGVTTGTDPRGHTGIDYDCPIGTLILASADGTVVYAGWNEYGWGNLMIIQHEPKKSTVYAHLDRVFVKVGQTVKQSDEIGTSGWSGNVVPKGPAGRHLHFEARTDPFDINSHFDPMDLPLISMDDNIQKPEKPEPAAPQQPIGAGRVRVVCDLPANVRNTFNPQIINGQKHKGDIFEITQGVRIINKLPYHRIVPKHVNDLGGLIAEYDAYGNQILEQVEK